VTTTPAHAGIYCRLSVARYGDTTKVEDQERISRRLCENLDWPIAEGLGWPQPNGVYVDNSRSAWQRNRKRPGWDQMLADVGAGKIDAIVVYHGDRLVRQPWDLEQLLNLADTKGIKLASPTGVRNLDDSQDRIMLRVLTAFACGSSDDTSRRKKDAFTAMRLRGRVRSGGRGGRAFGFATDGVTHLPPDRCIVATREEAPSEADIVREIAGRLLDGESTVAIARDISARGWRTPAGGEFTHGTIRKMMVRARYAGLMPDEVSQAAWEPVLDRETWEAVVLVLKSKAETFRYATNARRYLLSGIARCGACGAGLRVRAAYHRPGQTAYACVEEDCKKVSRSVALLDAYVAAAVVGRLAKPANPEGRTPAVPGLAAEWRALAGERAAVEAMIADRTKALHPLLARLDSLDGRLAELRELMAADAGARLRGRHAGITLEEFLAEPLGVRRALVSACYEVTVLPASRRGPGFRTEDVRLVPRVGSHRPGGEGLHAVGGAEADGDRGDDADDAQMPELVPPVRGGDPGRDA
jgi:DNA invertase Pin-like site-specific DNA recombinase